jgi:hypothetical protein
MGNLLFQAALKSTLRSRLPVPPGATICLAPEIAVDPFRQQAEV